MKILAWNIKWGGRNRIDAIANELMSRQPDVIVLNEYQTDVSDRLMQILRDAGWTHQLNPAPPPKFGGVAVLSKTEMVGGIVPEALTSFAHRYLPVEFPGRGLELKAVYAPLQHDPYADFWRGVLTDLGQPNENAVLLVGDLNACLPGADSPGSALFSSQYFSQLSDCGFSDLWRASHGAEAREFTWLGPVHPYRLDHAFGNAHFLGLHKRTWYDHSVREAAVSDHSLLSVEFE